MQARNAGNTLCVGFPPWRRSYVSAFLCSPVGKIKFISRKASFAKCAKGVDRIVLWGADTTGDMAGALANFDGEVWRVEDGFLRSVGLGKYYIPPISLVFDSSGIYYDPANPGDLEKILSCTSFSAEECERARELARRIVESGISKYNVGSHIPDKAALRAKAGARNLILVPGQVGNDASVRLGCETVNSDRALLAQVRSSVPGAFVLYKPHPDSVSGNVPDRDNFDAGKFADLVLEEADIGDCLECVDEVHTMTSLVGFEALLRRKKVVCYGRPFYAGWGLTEDRLTLPSRQRKLTLEELVAGVLIRYPRYMDYRTGQFIEPERALDKMILDKNNSSTGRIAASKPYRLCVKAFNLARSLVYGLQLKARRVTR